MLSAPDFKQKKIIFALLSRGERLSFKNDNIIITSEQDGIRHQSSCYRLFALFAVGHATITTGLLQRARKYGFSIVLMTHGLIPYGSWQARAEGNVLLRRRQYHHQGLAIARHLISNKIDQQLYNLKRRRKKPAPLQQAIASLQGYQQRLADAALGLQEILGIEGVASRVYFQAMFADMPWSGRRPRAKQDMINLLLDIGYMQLFHIIDALLSLYGFDTYQGVYHQAFYQRKSLVCDLVEPFRPIVDLGIRNAFQRGQIKENDFSYVNGQYRLFGKASQPYMRFLLHAILAHKQALFLYIQGYYRAFMQDRPIQQYPIFARD